MSNAVDVEVFDRLNKKIGQIRPSFSEITWLRNKYGRVQFTMATTDSKATEEFLQIGNRIYMRFENGLPDWGGVIELPRRWTYGQVEVTAYSGEYLLKFRRTDKGRYFSQDGVGTIARKLVEEANAIRPTGLTVGTIWPGGDTHSPEYHFDNLYSIFTRSLFDRLSTADWDVIPSVSSGEIIFTLNVYERRGANKAEVALHEGMNVTKNSSLDEQGPITNDVVTIGDGQGWGADRLVGSQYSQTSIDTYGLREDAQTYPGVSSPNTLQSAANTAISNSAYPHNLFTLEVADKAPGKFVQYDIGDSITAELPSFTFGGYRGLVDIEGRTYYPKSGVCSLLVRETV